MNLDIQKAAQKGIFPVADTVVAVNMKDCQIVYFDSHKPNHISEKIGRFLRRREDKTVVKYKLVLSVNRLGELEACWMLNIKPTNHFEIVQKLRDFHSQNRWESQEKNILQKYA